jgi:hypothetical protein
MKAKRGGYCPAVATAAGSASAAAAFSTAKRSEKFVRLHVWSAAGVRSAAAATAVAAPMIINVPTHHLGRWSVFVRKSATEQDDFINVQDNLGFLCVSQLYVTALLLLRFQTAPAS